MGLLGKRNTLVLCMLMASATVPAQSSLPSLGDAGSMTLSAERKLGDRIARELYRDTDYIDDPALAEYVQAIWQPLMQAARDRGEMTPELEDRFAWDVLLGRDRTVNAFALPGGYLGVHLGLIAVVSSRDELASVLAHELSHVTQRHISRLMGKQSQQTPWLVGSMILAALAASKNPQAASALLVGGQAVTVQNQLNFSRDMEREADRVGYGVMTQAGFRPQGFVSMFGKLQQASRMNDNGSFPYLRSHPLTTERIADMQGRQQLLPRESEPPLVLEHVMLAARAKVLAAVDSDVMRQWMLEPDTAAFARMSVDRQVMSLYTATLAAARQKDSRRANALLARLGALTAQDAAAHRLWRLLQAELQLDQGQPAAALALGYTATGPRPELLLSARAVVLKGEPNALSAMGEALQTWVTSHPRDGSAWQALAAVRQAMNQPLRAIRAEAEAQVARMDFSAAVDRLKAAQDVARRGGAVADHVEASIIDTRTREVSGLLREQAAER